LGDEVIDYEALNDEQKKAYYAKHGYVVYRKLIPQENCNRVLEAFRSEVKEYPGHIYRQTTANPERHALDSSGRVTNPILNPMCINPKKFPEFRNQVHASLSSDPLFKMVEYLLGEQAQMVQSMYFEVCAGTWAHQDTYYLDSERIGSMTAAWVALEDVHADAGRFFVGVGSHLIDMVQNGGNFDIAFNHDRYKALVLEIIEKHHIELRAPELKKGDVLFWNSKTIHGSYMPKGLRHSRNSLTAHFIPANDCFLQFQSRVQRLKTTEINAHQIFMTKDQGALLNRFVLNLESMAPKSFQMLKKVAVKVMTSKKP